mmetsp:Transcript_8512/g.15399  ORF Transcript_8512/g.15399 Transcript_8512/m.15399 type:complete len:121 (+) Transcript_8512:75-437(+)
MGKSVRSKIKRQHRKEFRETIGADAAKKSMEVVQSKLQECLQKGNMNSFERLSTVLATSDDEMETGNEPEPMEPLPPTEPPAKGENKVPTKRRREQKYRIKKKPREEPKEKRKPKYFCSF